MIIIISIIIYYYCCCYWDLIWGFLTTCQGLFTATPLHRGTQELAQEMASELESHLQLCQVGSWSPGMAGQDLFNLFNLPKKASLELLEPLASWYSICILDGL